MFSYGMVLYELLSGQRPALGHHQLQIAKKLSKGIRPVLGQPEEVQFHRLQALMMECWDTKPEKVPEGPAWGPGTSCRWGGPGPPGYMCVSTCPSFTKGLQQMGSPSPLASSRKRYVLLLIHPACFLCVLVTLGKK